MPKRTQPQNPSTKKRQPKSKKLNKDKDAMHLSPCSEHYAKLIGNPFVRSHSACIPSLPSRPSRKFSTYATGVVTPQTSNGLAMVTYNPWRMAVVNTATSPVVSTTASSTFSGLPTYNGANTIGYVSNSDYSGALNAAGLAGFRFRLVAAGLRLTYNGPLLNVGGRICGVEDPDHYSIVGLDYDALNGYEEAAQLPIKPNVMYEIIYNPVEASSFAYGSWATSADGSEFQYFANSNDATMGFIVQPADASTNYIVEAFAHFEAIGRPVRGTSPSHVDSLGLSAVLNTSGQTALRKPRAVNADSERVENAAIGLVTARVASSSLGELAGKAAGVVLEHGPTIAKYAAAAASLYTGGLASAVGTAASSMIGSATSRSMLTQAAQAMAA